MAAAMGALLDVDARSAGGDHRQGSGETEMTDATPFLMFEGRAEEALDFYIATVPESRIEHIDRYGAGEPGPEGSVRMARAVVAGLPILASDSFVQHAFTFT